MMIPNARISSLIRCFLFLLPALLLIYEEASVRNWRLLFLLYRLRRPTLLAHLSALQTTLENCFEGYTVHLWTEPNEDNPGICPECVLTPNQSIGILYPCELESEYRSFLYVIVVPSNLSPLFTLEELLESSARASGFYDKIEP